MVFLEFPAILTTLEGLKFDPFTVKVKSPSPAHFEVGEMEEMDGVGLSTSNELLVPASELPVLVAVMVIDDAPGLMVTDCEASTPAEKEAVVPLPAVRVPVDVISTVPVKLFVPVLQVLLLASLAVILMAKADPAAWVVMLPPADASIRKLLSAPGSTVIEELAIDFVPSVALIVCDGVVFNVNPAPANVCTPLSFPVPVVKIYLLPELNGRTAAPSVEVK